MSEALDLFALQPQGVQLIEASAGTGKTWTLSSLAVRLVAEHGHAVSELLIVTYTKAATAELRDRIRQRMVDAHAVLGGEREPGSDAFLSRLPVALDTAGVSRERALRRLTYAIRTMDEAAVYTIHSFCQRVLTDRAFECAMPFDAELVPDENALIAELVDDAWRTTVVDRHPLIARYLAEQGENADVWRRLIAPAVARPDMEILPADGETRAPANRQALAALEADFDAAWQLWHADGTRDSVRSLLLGGALKANIYRADYVEARLLAVDQLFASRIAPTRSPGDKLGYFTPAVLAASVKAGADVPAHPFFAAVERLLGHWNWLDDARTGLLAAAARECRDRLPALKAERRLLSYDDLLGKLDAALADPAHGDTLAARLAERYPLALIDEFQDTDPTQFRIFHAIYGQRGVAFYVGDPKQAIYGFRGADIHAYLQARDTARARHHLDTNWRSDRALIEAVNALFARTGNPFGFRGIPFEPVHARPGADDGMAGDGHAAMTVWSLPDDAALNKGDATALAVAAVANEIARQVAAGLDGRLTVGQRPLQAGDIAVLVDTHWQGAQVAAALAVRGVPSVLQTRDSVLASAEAGELQLLLEAVADPANAGKVRRAAALTGSALDAGGLYRLHEDGEALDAELARYADWRTRWQEQGFMSMFRDWLFATGHAARLVALGNGERRLTNWLHLGELIAGESERLHGLNAVIDWLARERDAARGGESTLLRLESDAQRVRIVTVHASKGLEYPVVFLPFAWNGALWHAHARSTVRVGTLYDYGSDALAERQALASVTLFAEKLRLLYVALTRARHRCHLVWGKAGKQPSLLDKHGTAKNSAPEAFAPALAWLLHPPPAGSDQADLDFPRLLDWYETVWRPLETADLDQAIASWPGVGQQRINAAPAPVVVAPRSNDTAVPLAAQPFLRGRVRPSWRRASFTSLAHAGEPVDVAPERDRSEVAPAPADAPVLPDPLSPAAFPRGARAGDLLHALFERIEFSAPAGAHHDIIATELRRSGLFSDDELAQWQAPLADWLVQILATPLLADGLTLSALPRHRRLVEMGFTFSSHTFAARALARTLADPVHQVDPAFIAAAAQLDFGVVDGFITGFIDLVFEHDGRYWLADYKSNHLGYRPADYDHATLTAAMTGSHYYLQALLYTLALHRHLRVRLADYDYDRHIGGVLYLFLRGIDGSGEHGVYRWRPARSLIEALDRLATPREETPA
ncbi:UvrD-helicase domain-containing protein [Microvirgula aerodenitrificans]|uniref:UvrD-helicase domain-containing protein n=1 Tax=Microvirgula aerodenitrificans TaxID=57480 RepID=UPI002F4222F5